MPRHPKLRSVPVSCFWLAPLPPLLLGTLYIRANTTLEPLRSLPHLIYNSVTTCQSAS